MNKFYLSTLTVACVVLAGCEDADDLPPAAATATAPAAQPAAAQPVATTPTTPDPASQPPVERQKAEVGVGRKGQGYGGGIITEPLHQYFAGKDRITFEIQIPEGMKLFQAEHNRYPKDMAEFKRAILEPASIRLPDLYPGDKYVYDAETHELMVERQVPAGTPGSQ
jgi:hypothetical protein